MVAGCINSKARFLRGDAVELPNFSATLWLHICAPQCEIKPTSFILPRYALPLNHKRAINACRGVGDFCGHPWQMSYADQMTHVLSDSRLCLRYGGQKRIMP